LAAELLAQHRAELEKQAKKAADDLAAEKLTWEQ